MQLLNQYLLSIMSHLHLTVDVGLCELVRDMEIRGQGLEPAAPHARWVATYSPSIYNNKPLIMGIKTYFGYYIQICEGAHYLYLI